MKAVLYVALPPLLFSIIGFIFSLRFELMAYWGHNMMWYWVGACVSYIFSILAIVYTLLTGIKLTKIDTMNSKLSFTYLITSLISIFIAMVAIILTTFIICVWQTKM
ncbi:hypothetical protein [Heyndrickxia sporothermodurans]|uniref:hypothetical protein n=1 Tax=Heyndrickxia sporothermodurans TaxID=46224 RepID=UPI002E242E7C|nr:hypothetical protein [Heyndrickxia sporothermodurans]MED3697730.1 hypothetical protein [Heyndrickxia sporothermodurans]MED3779995.1 hypothetical protein [Heyndrickxia sporothermodurans]